MPEIASAHRLQTELPEGILLAPNPGMFLSFPHQPGLRTPLRRQKNGSPQFVVVLQTTKDGKDVILSIPDALGISGDTHIGLSRANRIVPPRHIPEANSENECALCKEAELQKERRRVYVVNNPRPFGPMLHKAVFSHRHVNSLGSVSFDELLDANELFVEIARSGRKSAQGKLEGLTIGMNFGGFAGATQFHYHYQVAGLGQTNYNAGDRIGTLCQVYRSRYPDADYLKDYEQVLRKADLVIFEEPGLALAYVPISPRFKGEVQIMLLREGVGNILETTRQERAAIAELQYQVIRCFHQLRCTAFNQVWYMSRFTTKNNFGQRLIVSLCPRTSVIGFYELSGNYEVDAWPWRIARALRASANDGFTLE